MNLRELVATYTDVWSTADVDRFRALVLDGCIRHDPGSSVAISLADNEARFLDTHQRFPDLQHRVGGVMLGSPSSVDPVENLDDPDVWVDDPIVMG